MFINFLVEKNIIPEVSKGIWQYVADDQLKGMLVKFDIIDQVKADQLWREYVFARRQHGKSI